MPLHRLTHILAVTSILLAPACAQDVHLKVIAINDFHGNLQSPGNFRSEYKSPSVPAGGIDYLAGYVAQLKQQNPVNVVVSAGDLTGASPLVSALFHDEDTIETMNRLGLEINAVGNHEFDKGPQELLRKQHGGGSSQDANTCQGALTGTPVPFEGAHFQYLAANVYDTKSGKTIFPPYAIKTYDGIRVAFIGLTLQDTPSIVTASGVAGLRFTAEAGTVNTIVRDLRKQGIEAFVVLIHEGGQQTTRGAPDINACAGDLKGSPMEPFVAQLDDAVDVVISAHTHQPYVCQLPNSVGRKISVSSASSYGRVLTSIDLTLDRKSKDVTNVVTRNILVDRTNPAITPDPAIAHIVELYIALAAPIVNRVVGSIASEITRIASPAGEDAMGDLIADAQLEATHSPATGAAVAAFMNEGGIRTGLPFVSRTPGIPDGKVTYGQLFTAQPFANDLVIMTLTGDQLRILLEEQFKGCALGVPGEDNEVPTSTRLLDVSEGFSYTLNSSAPPCSKVVPGSIKIHGIPLKPAATYRITVNSLLAGGGAQFYILKHGTDRRVGPQDLEAMIAYFAKHPAVAPLPLDRIQLEPTPAPAMQR